MLTAEQIAARAAERAAKKAARAATIKAATNDTDKAALAIEGIAEDMDGKIEDLGEGQEQIRKSLHDQKADIEALAARMKSRAAGKHTEGMDVEQFNIGKMVLAFHAGRVDDSTKGLGYELEAMEAGYKGFTDSQGRSNLTKKDLISAIIGSSGGLGLPTQIQQSIQPAGRSESVLFGLGVKNPNMEGMAGFAVPYEVQADGQTAVTSGKNMTAGSIQEGGAVGVPQRVGFRLAQFTPRKMASVVGYTEDILKQGGGFIKDFTMTYMGRDFKTTLERNCFTGRGQQFSEPMGILNRTDMTPAGLANAVSSGGRWLTPSDFGDMEMALADIDRLNDNLKYVTRAIALKNIRHEAATQNLSGATELNSKPRTEFAYMNIKKLAESLGIDLRTSTNIPKNFDAGSSYLTATAMAAGDWSNVWIPFWGPLEVLMSREASVGGVSAFENCLAYARFVQMYDCNIIDPSWMIVQKGFKTV